MNWVRSATSGVRAAGRMSAVAVTMLAVACLGACTGQDEPGIPTAGGPTTGGSTAADPQAQELAFVACMREEGIADMPDPVPGDTSGRSAVKYAIDVMGKGSDQVFQAALDECMTLLPPPPAPDPGSTAGTDETRREFSQCMRENGAPDFPDLDGDDVVVGTHNPPGDGVDDDIPPVEIFDNVIMININDPVVGPAVENCSEMYPLWPVVGTRS